jgi:pimeloyl-ACP methyl ester carboxylesterase
MKVLNRASECIDGKLLLTESMFARSIHSVRRRLLDRLVLEPSREPIDHGAQRKEVLSFDGRPLETFVQSNTANGEPIDLVVLKFPGTAGRAERSTEFPMSFLPHLRVSMWTWNPPGYGGSGGRATMDSITKAALAFWRQVAQRVATPDTHVWLCANSLGCATALHVAASIVPDKHRCGIILRNPPPLIPVFRRIANRYPFGRLAHSIGDTLCEEMNAVSTASQTKWPAVFLQSELDTLVPPKLQQQIIDAYAGPKQVVCMEGLAHGGPPTEIHEPEIRSAIDWLWQRT